MVCVNQRMFMDKEQSVLIDGREWRSPKEVVYRRSIGKGDRRCERVKGWQGGKEEYRTMVSTSSDVIGANTYGIMSAPLLSQQSS